MSDPTLEVVTLVVRDLAASVAFYRTVFSPSEVFHDDDSHVFRFGGPLLNLLRREAADELVAPATVGSAGDGVRAVFTVPVNDVDAVVRRWAELGVTVLNGPVTRPWGPWTAAVADPDGHVWEIASNPSA